MVVCKVKCTVITRIVVPRMLGRGLPKLLSETAWLTREEAKKRVLDGRQVCVPVQRYTEENTVGFSQPKGAYYCALYFIDELPLQHSTWP
jgi:hypothetical protein